MNNIFIHILFRTTSIPLGNRSVVGHDEKHLTIWDSRPDNSSWDVSIYQVTMTNSYSIIVCFANSNKIRLLGAWHTTSRYKTRKYFLLHIFWIDMTERTIQFLIIFSSSKITLFKCSITVPVQLFYHLLLQLFHGTNFLTNFIWIKSYLFSKYYSNIFLSKTAISIVLF